MNIFKEMLKYKIIKIEELDKLNLTLCTIKESYEDLHKVYTQLKENFEILGDEYDLLEVEKDYVEEQLKNKKKEENLETYWNNKIKHVESFKYKARADIKDLRKKTDIDPRIFFTEIDNSVPMVTGDSYDEIALKSMRLVKNMITYSRDPTQYKANEMWLFAYETMKYKIGDCEDGAILMGNIMLKSGIPYWRIRINAGSVQGGGHCYVTYLREKDNKWVVLDWCYWYKKNGILWEKADKYHDIWFSFNKRYIFVKDKLDRVSV